jgi:hypothetical protein
MGMRKDFILSEEEKQRRKKIIDDNRSESTNLQSSLHSEALTQTLDEVDRVNFYQSKLFLIFFILIVSNGNRSKY